MPYFEKTETQQKIMDLTSKPSTPWWSLFNCCRPPASSSDEDEHNAYSHEDTTTASTASTASSTKLKIVTGGKVVVGDADLPDTPATACTDYSADVSVDSQEDDFIGEIAVSTPRYEKAPTYAYEKVDDFRRETTVPTPRSSSKTFSPERFMEEEVEDFDDEMSDPDEANYWYEEESSSLDENQRPTKAYSTNKTQNTDDIVTEIEVSKKARTTNNAKNTAKNPQMKSTQDQLEIKFYQFMALMMLRHVFGSSLPKELDPMTNIFNAKLLLTQCSNSEKKEFRKMMKLRTLQWKDDKCEVVPQLRRRGV